MTPSDDERRKIGALEQSAKTLQRSSKNVSASAEQLKDSADRRTELAANRTVLAAERTYAAWVRTGLASLASGIGAKKLLEGVISEWMIIATGSLLVLFSAFCFVVAVWREMFPGAPPPEPDTRRIPPPLLIIANGFLTLVALAALVSIWFGHTGGK
jgi:putative membrane protein